MINRVVQRMAQECTNNKWMEQSSHTSSFSLFDLLSSKEFCDAAIKCHMDNLGDDVGGNDGTLGFIEALQDVLYTVGFDKTKPIHLCKRMHRPLSKQQLVLNDWVVLYHQRKDDYWIKNYANLEDTIQSIDDTSMRGEMIALENRESRVDPRGGFKECVLREPDSYKHSSD